MLIARMAGAIAGAMVKGRALPMLSTPRSWALPGLAVRVPNDCPHRAFNLLD